MTANVCKVHQQKKNFFFALFVSTEQRYTVAKQAPIRPLNQFFPEGSIGGFMPHFGKTCRSTTSLAEVDKENGTLCLQDYLCGVILWQVVLSSVLGVIRCILKHFQC